MPGRTNAVTAGGSTPTTGDYLVRYFDIDGTILKEQWVDSGQNATPPTNPTYNSLYLTFNTWNNISTNVLSDRDIGAIYDTLDGKTYAFITLTTVSGVAPTLYLNKSDGSTLSINWGDGNTSTFTNTGNFNTGAHTYSAIGNYVITIWISSGTGTYQFGNSTGNTFISGSVQNYKSTLKKIYIGSSVTTMGDYSFWGCTSLYIISISISVTVLGVLGFRDCNSLKHISIPNLVTSTSDSLCYNCSSLVSISIPIAVTIINTNTFYLCYSLASIIISSAVNTIGNQAFSDCYQFKSVNVPNTVTSIGTYIFNRCYSLISVNVPNTVTSIGSSMFASCQSLLSLSISSTVTSIGTQAFYNCYCITIYKFYRSTPPTLSNTNAFSAINPTCKIYVPDAALSTYKTATNWTFYANYIYPLSDIGE